MIFAPPDEGFQRASGYIHVQGEFYIASGVGLCIWGRGLEKENCRVLGGGPTE